MNRHFLSRTVAVLLIGAVSLVSTSGLAATRAAGQSSAPVPAQADVKRPAKKQNAPKAAKTTRKATEPQSKPRGTTKARRDAKLAVEPQLKPRATTKPARLPSERREAIIVAERERTTKYRDHISNQERLAQERSQALRQQRRMAQYQYQQQYYSALRRQRLAIENARYYDYDRDPYYYTAPNYRYYRGGTYYQTNQYGADLIRQAVNYGYQQGYRAGDADRRDRWHNGFEDGFAYQDANYGYYGRYVDQYTYNYYFREGYRRGYYDGYNHRYDYGHHSNSNAGLIVLASVLAGIIVFEAITDDDDY